MVEVKTTADHPRSLQDKEPKCPFLQLPHELIYLIISFLPSPWIVSLGLTCKAFRSLTDDARLEKADGLSRCELLAALQKDLPGTYFCFCCLKLRYLEPDENWDAQPHKWTPGLYQPRSWWLSEHTNIWHVPTPYHYPTFKSQIRIDFMEAYMVMNSHFLGPSHGLPLKSLERFVSFQDQIELSICQPSGSHGNHAGDHGRRTQGLVSPCYDKADDTSRMPGLWKFSHKMIPRIVDGKLYLARFYKLNGPLVPWQCLARLIGSMEPEVCRHLRCTAGSTPPFCNLVPVILNGNDAPRLLPGNGLYMLPMCVSSESGSCMICSTDYDISVQQHKEENEWSFCLSAYHCLGSCRTPRDELWNWFVNDVPGRTGDPATRQQERARRLAKVLKLAGTTRQKWIQGGESPVVIRGGKQE